MMKLSVIVPVYNAEKYLRILLDSVVNQTYENKEIILVDDGATDHSGKICDDYSQKYEFVHVIHTENRGVQSARNTGLNAATGDYIALADSDDAIDLDCYEILINAMENTGSDVSCCGFKNEYTTNMHMISKHAVVPEPYVITGRKKCLLSISDKEHCSAGFMWNKVYKKEIISSVRFRQDIVICDDLYFTYEALNGVEKICIVDLPLYHYRYLTISMSKAGNIDKFGKCLNGLEKLNDWGKTKAPFCMEGLYVNYIFWNTKACEMMLTHVDKDFYNKIKDNIISCQQYVPYCPGRIRVLSRAIMRSWRAYAVYGWFFWYMKKLYIFLRKRKLKVIHNDIS